MNQTLTSWLAIGYDKQLIDSIKKKYPPRPRQKRAIAGYIPIALFNKYEELFRYVMKKNNMRIYYNGPRRSNETHRPASTMRCDATHVSVYYDT